MYGSATSDTESADMTRVSAPSSRQREALELEHLGSCRGEHFADGLRAVVDPRLVGEHAPTLGEEALVEHPGHDLLTRLLGLRLHLVGAEVDVALGRDQVL